MNQSEFSRQNQITGAKRENRRASNSRLVLVLFLIGFESGARFPSKLKNMVQQNQNKRENYCGHSIEKPVPEYDIEDNIQSRFKSSLFLANQDEQGTPVCRPLVCKALELCISCCIHSIAKRRHLKSINHKRRDPTALSAVFIQ